MFVGTLMDALVSAFVGAFVGNVMGALVGVFVGSNSAFRILCGCLSSVWEP